MVTVQVFVGKFCWWVQFRCPLSNFVGEHRAYGLCQSVFVATAPMSFVNTLLLGIA